MSCIRRRSVIEPEIVVTALCYDVAADTEQTVCRRKNGDRAVRFVGIIAVCTAVVKDSELIAHLFATEIGSHVDSLGKQRVIFVGLAVQDHGIIRENCGKGHIPGDREGIALRIVCFAAKPVLEGLALGRSKYRGKGRQIDLCTLSQRDRLCLRIISIGHGILVDIDRRQRHIFADRDRIAGLIAVGAVGKMREAFSGGSREGAFRYGHLRSGHNSNAVDGSAALARVERKRGKHRLIENRYGQVKSAVIAAVVRCETNQKRGAVGIDILYRF